MLVYKKIKNSMSENPGFTTNKLLARVNGTFRVTFIDFFITKRRILKIVHLLYQNSKRTLNQNQTRKNHQVLGHFMKQ